MFQYIEILIIAVVQGIGEFLPISSSSHIAITNTLFGLSGHPLANNNSELMKLEVCLHLGTFITVLTVLRKYIIDMLLHNPRLLCQLIVATIPAVIVFLTVKKSLPGITENYYLMSAGFIFTGIILLTTLKAPDGKNGGNPEGLKTHSNLPWTDAVLIGCMQAVAIFPGVSRFGSTMFAGLFRRLQWRESIIFSFMLSLPVVAGSGLLEIKHLFKEAPQTEPALSGIQLGLGLLVSCAVGFLALLWLFYKFPKGKLWYFSIWVFLMAPFAFILAWTDENNDNNSMQTAAAVPQTNCFNAGISSKREFEQISSGTTVSRELPVSVQTDVPENAAPENSLTKAIEAATSDRLNMSREEALREYEKIVAEEEAKEKAAIEEEKKRIPFVNEPEKLIQIDREDKVWLTPDKKSVVALGRIALREGLLELFACRVGTKEHESIVSMRVKPYMLHAALLAAGAESGKPVQVAPKFVPPSGDEIEVKVRWKDENGEVKEVSAQDWVLDEDETKKSGKNTAMKSNWVFSGSMMYKDEDGKNHYVADETGELFGLSNFAGAILDVPFESSADNADLLFTCFTERIPELYTPVTLILTPVKKTAH